MATRWTAAAALALLALAAPTSLAQAGMGATGATLVLEDPAGDVKTDINGQPAAGGETAYPSVDLRGLTVQESGMSWTFTIAVAALTKDSDPGVDGVVYQVYFAHNGREFDLAVQQGLPAVSDGAFSFLRFRDSSDGEWTSTWSTDEVILDESANTLSVEIPREMLVDQDGAAPFPGRTLDGIHVVSQSLFSHVDGNVFDQPVTTPQGITDALPNTAPYPALAALLGIAQTGHARLSSAMPFRASNGEATTFVYNVTATNIGDQADTFELEATSVPAGYTIVLPVPALALEPGENATVPVLLTMPFGHQHGSLASLVLEMRSLSDAGSVGRLEIGVRFLAVPQPAGHHDTVYLHTGATGNDVPIGIFGPSPGYLNTLEDDPNDLGVADCNGAFNSGGIPPQSRTSWDYPLEPGLQMGIDVDPLKVGHLKVPISSTVPVTGAQLGANLYLEPPRGEDFERPDLIHLAGMALTAPMDLGGGGAAKLFEGDFKPNEDAPRVAFQEGSNLVLWLTFVSTTPNTANLAGDDGICIQPGGSVTLPLEEWHDAVDEILSSLDGPGLSPFGPQERLVNPGEAVVFPVSIANPLDESVRFELETTGPNAAWATLSGDSIEVAAHSTAQATVVVRAPVGAVDGERADLVLQAYPRDDPTARGLLRLVAEVDTEADQVDDTAIAPAPATKDSPGLGGLAAGLALAALAWSRRRSR